jgi:hypothetical protein
MHINRDNYESWFLLYIDAELSAAEQQEVEAFVAAHPDLKAELDLLLDTRLTDDTHVAFDKSILLRSEQTAINSNNYEEQFLLYVDEELDASSKAAVETFVLQHPEKQDTFTLLKQTKLEPEQIIFPDKASLYREEQKERPVMFMQWRRLAVAAALIGMAVLVWTIVPQNQPTQSSLAGNTAPVQSGNTTDQRNQDAAPSTTNQVIANEQAFANTRNKVAEQQPQIRFANTTEEKNNPDAVTNDLLNRQEDVIASVTDESKTGTLANIHNNANTTATIAMDPVMVAAKAEDSPPAKTNTIQQAVYRELDTDDDRKTLYLGAVEINKDKLRGIFRKASSIFKSKVKQAEPEEESNSTSTVNSASTRSSLD